MLKKDEKEMFRKFTYIAKFAVERAEKNGYLRREIAEQAGILQSRVTEVTDPEKYKKNITEEALVSLIQGGFIKLEDLDNLEHDLKLTPVELKYFKRLYKDAEVTRLAARLEGAGVNPVKILREALKQAKNNAG